MSILFSTAKIGKLTLKNRIIMSPLHLGFSTDGQVNEREIAFYRERAAGGPAAIIFGGVAVEKKGALPGMPLLTDEIDLSMYKKLVNTIKEYDCRIFFQLFHAGKNAYSDTIGEQAVGPSQMRSALTGEEVREMTTAEVKETVRNFARSAVLAKEAGADGVEISASVGYLLSEFLSPRLNKRTDEYGGTPENNMRFPLEVVNAVRESVGTDFVVGMRISGSEMIEGGADLDFMLDFTSRLKDVLDVLHVTGGWHEAPVPQITAHVPPGGYAFLAAEFKTKLGIPVIAANRINDGKTAEEIIEKGKADFVGMGRGFIADPELANRIKEGEIFRKCIACNQGCIEEIFKKNAVRCLVNARVGIEQEFPLEKSAERKKILIIGDGPAGMEAARSAAERGHDVKLISNSDELGGQLRLALVPPDKHEMKNLLDYLKSQLVELGVEVIRADSISEELLRKEHPDHVIVATGAEPLIPSIPGIENVELFKAWDVLDPEKEIVLDGKTVIIGGGSVGLETGLYLADKKMQNSEGFLLQYAGKLKPMMEKDAEIVVIEMQRRAGGDVGGSNRWVLLNNLRQSGVKVEVETTVKEVKPGRLVVDAKGEEKEIEYNNLILALGARPQGGELVEMLEKGGYDFTVIGDAVKPRKLIEAIFEGYQAGYI